MYLSLSTIAISLVGRAAIDKFIALGGGPDLLASWAQLQSVMDLVSGAAVAGVAPGVSVLVAQSAARLLWLGDTMTPTKIGAMWLLTYAIYAGFNAYALARVMRSSAIERSKAT